MPSLLKDKFLKGKDQKSFIKQAREKLQKLHKDKLAEYHSNYSEFVMSKCGQFITKWSESEKWPVVAKVDKVNNPNRIQFCSKICVKACRDEFGDEVAQGMVQSIARECEDTFVGMGFRTVKVQVCEYIFNLIFIILTLVLESSSSKNICVCSVSMTSTCWAFSRV